MKIKNKDEKKPENQIGLFHQSTENKRQFIIEWLKEIEEPRAKL